MSISNILVTIYITTYKRPEKLKRAILSVIKQDYKNIEIIVVDDDPLSKNKTLINFLNNRYKTRVKYIKNKKNYGACFSRNLALKKAKGEFITGLDDDDYLHENLISSFLIKWKKRNKKTIALCANQITIKNNKILNKWRKSLICRNNISSLNVIGNQIFTKKKVLQKINGFNNKLEILQDYDCWLRLLNKFKNKYVEVSKKSIYFIDNSNIKKRISNNKISKISNSLNIMFAERVINKDEYYAIKFIYDLKLKKKINLLELFNKFIIDKSIINFKHTLYHLNLYFFKK